MKNEKMKNATRFRFELVVAHCFFISSLELFILHSSFRSGGIRYARFGKPLRPEHAAVAAAAWTAGGIRVVATVREAVIEAE
jgi:hypothetical protein